MIWLLWFMLVFISPANAQCNGTFSANNVCGTTAGGPPAPVASTAFPTGNTPPGAGGQAVLVSSILNRTLWANDYGAVCNPSISTDDHAAFQNAINEAFNVTNSVVRFINNCAITNALIMPAIDFGGTGQLESILSPAIGISAITMASGGPARLHDFQISYPSLSNAGTAGIFIDSTSAGTLNVGTIVDHVTISNAYYGIKLGNAVSSAISDNIINGSGHSAIFIDSINNIGGGDNGFVNNNISITGASNCVEIAAGSGIRFSANKCVGDNTAGSAAVLVNLASIASNFSNDLIISANSLENKTYALRMVRNNSTATWTNLVLDANETEPVSMMVSIPTDASGAWVSIASITNNSQTSSGATDFVNINSITNFIIANNITQSNTKGITTGSAATKGLISDNHLFGTTPSPKYTIGASSVVVKDGEGDTFANLPSTIANGSQFFISDADPASSPCTHAGAQTGATAFRQNGAWKCF